MRKTSFLTIRISSICLLSLLDCDQNNCIQISHKTFKPPINIDFRLTHFFITSIYQYCYIFFQNKIANTVNCSLSPNWSNSSISILLEYLLCFKRLFWFENTFFFTVYKLLANENNLKTGD